MLAKSAPPSQDRPRRQVARAPPEVSARSATAGRSGGRAGSAEPPARAPPTRIGAGAGSYRTSSTRCVSLRRAPAMMPCIPMFPSWQAYSNSGPSVRRSGIIIVHGRA